MEICTCASPVGDLLLAAEDGALCGLWLRDQKYFGSTLAPRPVQNPFNPVFLSAENWLDRYFDGEKPEIGELPLAPKGSAFRQQVWQLLCEIPYGETVTYGALASELASRLGRETMSAQAVGGAVGHNPISIIIPCHRVVGADGSLTGYAGGIQKKLFLLRHEGASVERLYVPEKGTAL